MRIGIVWDTRTQWLGGWNYFLNMARVTRAFAPGIRFVLLSSPDLSEAHSREARDAGAEVILSLAPIRRFTHPLVLLGARHRGLDAALQAARIDFVFELTNYLGKLSVPALAWIPDAQHRALPHLFSRHDRLRRDLEFRRRLIDRRHVMLSSEAARRDIIGFMPRPPAQLHVVPFAVRPILAVDDAAIAAAQARHGLAPGYIYLPNQFWQHKNHELALRAVALLAQRGTDISLVLSGQALDTRASGHAAGIANLLATLPGVKMLGVIPYPDLLALVAGSRALFNPSLFEGWSTTVEEAKALGARMVLSNLPVHREQADGNAIFFDPRSVEAMAEALTQAMAYPAAPDTARRETATKANLDAQKIYAEKLEAVCRAAVNGG